MEEERLARLSKRKASSQTGDDGQPAARPAQRPRMADEGQGEMVSFPGKTSTGLGSSFLSSGPDPSLNPSRASAATGLPFPKGVVKKTWVYGQPRKGDDIKIEEVLQKQHLQLAVLSSYQWDEEWMLSKIDIARTKLILVAFAANDAQVRARLFCTPFFVQVKRKDLADGPRWTERGDAVQRAGRQDPVLLPAHAWFRLDALQVDAAQVRKVPTYCGAYRELDVV